MCPAHPRRALGWLTGCTATQRSWDLHWPPKLSNCNNQSSYIEQLFPVNRLTLITQQVNINCPSVRCSTISIYIEGDDRLRLWRPSYWQKTTERNTSVARNERFVPYQSPLAPSSSLFPLLLLRATIMYWQPARLLELRRVDKIYCGPPHADHTVHVAAFVGHWFNRRRKMETQQRTESKRH